MYELVALTTHTIVTTHTVFSREFVEVVVDTLAPVLRMLSFEQRHERYPLDVSWDGSTSKFQEGGCIVDVLHHFVDVTTCLKPLRKMHEERGVQ